MSEKSQYGQTVKYDVSAVLHDFHTSKSHVQYVRTVNHGTMLMMDGEIQYSTLDEHRYHYLLTTPMFQQSRNILILGGGDGLAARNLYKSPSTTSITIVDWDSDFVEFAKTNLTENMGSLVDPRTKFVFTDALAYVSTTSNTYDGVIIDLPDPDGDEMEALYIDLLSTLPRVLDVHAIVTAHVGPVSLCNDHPCWAFIANCKKTMKGCFKVDPVFDKVYVPSFSHEWGFLSCFIGGIFTHFPRFPIENDVRNIYSTL
jgi:predicted membrane-bound spermidine synthase